MSEHHIRVLRDRRAELECRLSEVDALLTLLGAAPEDAPEPLCEVEADAAAAEVPPRRGKVLEAVPRLSLAEKPRPAAPRGQADRRRHQIARLLADGPKQTGELARALNLTSGAVSCNLSHPWFEKTGPEMRDPYRLTDLGREQALETGGGTAGTAADR